jgi:hypothetical protein
VGLYAIASLQKLKNTAKTKKHGYYIDNPENVGTRLATLLVGKGKHQNATRCVPKSSKQNQLFSYVFYVF